MLGKCLSLENLRFSSFPYSGPSALFLSLRLIQSVLDFFVTFFIKEKSKENLKHERWPLQPHLRITQRLAISSDREHKTLIGTNRRPVKKQIPAVDIPVKHQVGIGHFHLFGIEVSSGRDFPVFRDRHISSKRQRMIWCVFSLVKCFLIAVDRVRKQVIKTDLPWNFETHYLRWHDHPILVLRIPGSGH